MIPLSRLPFRLPALHNVIGELFSHVFLFGIVIAWAGPHAGSRGACGRDMSRATALLTLAALASAATGAAVAADATADAPCAAAQYHQLDFWLGDWDVYDVDVHVPGCARTLTRRLEGCVVHELYESADATGTRGESFSIFDRTRGVWHQTWVTNRGRLLRLRAA